MSHIQSECPNCGFVNETDEEDVECDCRGCEFVYEIGKEYD
jgi:phage FluMu protein Com